MEAVPKLPTVAGILSIRENNGYMRDEVVVCNSIGGKPYRSRTNPWGATWDEDYGTVQISEQSSELAIAAGQTATRPAGVRVKTAAHDDGRLHSRIRHSCILRIHASA